MNIFFWDYQQIQSNLINKLLHKLDSSLVNIIVSNIVLLISPPLIELLTNLPKNANTLILKH